MTRLHVLFRRFRNLGLNRQLQAAAVLLLAALLLLATHQLIRTRSALLYQTKVQMARLDMVFAEQTGRALESVDLLLHSAAESYRSDPSASGGLLNEALRRRMAMVHQTSGIGIVDSEGRMLSVTSPAMEKLSLPPQAVAVVDAAIADPAAGLHISPPFRLPDGTWTALMVRCTLGGNGVRPAAAVALLNLSYFEDFYKAVELTEKGAILLHLRDGTVLARYPHDDGLMGTSFADLPPFRDILDKGQMAGTLIMDSPLDGSTRVLAIRALKAFPVAVNVSVEQYRVLGLWRRQAVLFSVLCASIGFVTAGLVWILARRTREREELLGRLARANARMANEMKERERVERALRQAQRAEAIGRITGGVAHDFNNLLAIVMGNIDLMERTLPPNETTLNCSATMRAAVERGATLTSQLLAFARRQPLMPRPADVRTLVSGLQNLVQSAIGSRIQLVLQLPPRLPPATLDPAQIELVLLNLAINARDAMPDGGTLTISAEHARVELKEHEEFEAGEYVVLSVTDTGVGMEPEVAARAFEPFFTTKEVGRGSGLGLSSGLWGGAAARWRGPAGEHGAPRHHSARLPPARRWRRGTHRTPSDCVLRSHAGAYPGGGRRRSRAHHDGRPARADRIRCVRSLQRRRGARCFGLRAAHRRAADRCRDAQHDRTGAGTARPHGPSRSAHRVHHRILGSRFAFGRRGLRPPCAQAGKARRPDRRDRARTGQGGDGARGGVIAAV